MLKITADVRVINREKCACPNDGVHRTGKDGSIKGCHSLWFNDKLVPKGQTAFYWRLNEDQGLRVSYSFDWLRAISEGVVEREYHKMQRMYALGLSPRPFNMDCVKLHLNYRHEHKKISTLAYCILVQHCHYPEKAWLDYANGKPYDWSAVVHPSHTPEGYKAFVEHGKKTSNGLVDTSWKLGDVVWCCKEERWYLVDCGA